jgi:16S rRNA (guanine1207-N2)-methyltransferase
MGEHYYSPTPKAPHRPKGLTVHVRGVSLQLRTDAGVFSRGRLDRGSELLLEAFSVGPRELILDLGCGYGVLGIVAAKLSEGGHVILTDVNARAVALSEENLRINGVRNAEVRLGNLYSPVAGLTFDHILCNPPLRAGRKVVDRIVSEGAAHLLDGGHLWLVARTKQGAEALRGRMAEAFGSAEVVKRGGGYKVLRSRKEANAAP